MTNVRGIQVLAIIGLVTKFKEIKLEDIANYLSTHDPYIRPVSTLKIIDQLSKGLDPQLKIKGDAVVLYKRET